MSIEFKGTPGDWNLEVVETEKGSYCKVSTDKESICNITTRDSFRAAANGRAIASIPAMIEGLKLSVMVMPNGHSRNQIKDLIKTITE